MKLITIILALIASFTIYGKVEDLDRSAAIAMAKADTGENTSTERLLAKGARNGCVRGHTMYAKTNDEKIDLIIKATWPCEKLHWQILKELRDARK